MRTLILVVIVLAAGCSKDSRRDVQTPTPPALSVDAAVVAIAIDAAVAPVEGACTRDDECVVTTWGDNCCGCCPCDQPHAALRAAVSARRDVCARKDCAKPNCAAVQCVACEFPPYRNQDDRPGKCVAGACVMP